MSRLDEITADDVRDALRGLGIDLDVTTEFVVSASDRRAGGAPTNFMLEVTRIRLIAGKGLVEERTRRPL